MRAAIAASVRLPLLCCKAAVPFLLLIPPAAPAQPQWDARSAGRPGTPPPRDPSARQRQSAGRQGAAGMQPGQHACRVGAVPAPPPRPRFEHKCRRWHAHTCYYHTAATLPAADALQAGESTRAGKSGCEWSGSHLGALGAGHQRLAHVAGVEHAGSLDVIPAAGKQDNTAKHELGRLGALMSCQHELQQARQRRQAASVVDACSNAAAECRAPPCCTLYAVQL